MVFGASYLYLSDNIGNYKFMYKADIESLFGPGVASITNTTNFSDISAPQITSFSLSPKVVNTETESQEVTLTADLTDDFAGVSYVSVYFTPDDGTTQRLSFYLRRVSGDSLKGTYTGKATLPIGSREGVWSISYLYLSDNIGNYKFMYKADVESLFGTGVASITNEATFSDITPPEFVIDEDTTAPSVDAGTDKTTNALFTQDGTALDAESGIASYAWTKESGPGEITFGSANAEDTNVSASADGTYVLRLTVTDKAGNSAYDEMILTAPASEPDPEEPVTDSSAPQLAQFVLTPKVVNTEDSDRELNLMVHLTDELKGVYAKGDQADPSYSGSTVMLRLRPEAGGDEKVDFILERISGDDLKGVYRARPIMPKGSKLGVWRVEYLYLVDKAGNHKYLSADEIDALLPGKQGTTIINEGNPKKDEPNDPVSEDKGPETFGKGYSAKTISKRKAPRYKKLYNTYKSKYRKAKNKKLKKRYKKAASKYLKYYRLARKGTATAKVKFMAQCSSGKSNLIVKIRQKVKSKSRAKKQSKYKKLYRKFASLYRKAKNKTLKKRYKKLADKYKKASRRVRVTYYKNVKTVRAGWTDSGVWKNYKYTGKKGLYKFYVYATDQAGKAQHNIAKGSFRIK